MNPVSADAPMLRALHKVTGYSSFRPTQQEAIEAVCEGEGGLMRRKMLRQTDVADVLQLRN